MCENIGRYCKKNKVSESLWRKAIGLKANMLTIAELHKRQGGDWNENQENIKNNRNYNTNYNRTNTSTYLKKLYNY